MKQTSRLLKGLGISMPKAEHVIYKPLSLTSISPGQLPNNVFESKNLYSIKKTKFGHWPVYKKVQNTRTSTEIKRIEGNIKLFVEEITKLIGNVPRKNLKMNLLTGEVNIKGDHVRKIKALFEKHL